VWTGFQDFRFIATDPTTASAPAPIGGSRSRFQTFYAASELQ
jgi:hypothetical protein